MTHEFFHFLSFYFLIPCHPSGINCTVLRFGPRASAARRPFPPFCIFFVIAIHITLFTYQFHCNCTRLLFFFRSGRAAACRPRRDHPARPPSAPKHPDQLRISPPSQFRPCGRSLWSLPVSCSSPIDPATLSFFPLSFSLCYSFL